MTDDQAQSLWQHHSGRAPDKITRLRTGSCNYVFLVEDQGQRSILRATDLATKDTLRGSEYWLTKLSAFPLSIPRLLASEFSGEHPYLVLSYLDGADLGEVYSSLTAEQKKAIARDVWTAQRTVSQLVHPRGYGYLSSLEDDRFKAGWRQVVEGHLARSRSWMRESGFGDESFIDRAEAWLPEFYSYFNTVEPRAFFDDTTTKNVLIHEGRFSGIVDLDWLCFGDRLYTIALTRMSLLESGQSLDYIDFLITEEGVADVQRRVLSFYTLVFCVDFMGGLGMQFNKPEKPVVTEEQKSRLASIFENLSKELS